MEVLPVVREDAATSKTFKQKQKKAESLEKLFSSIKTLASSKENNPQHREAFLCLRLSKSLPFLFYTNFLFFTHRSPLVKAGSL
ncbi:MAG: hypothetical protein H0X49_06550 [Acidobacteria bacterium]|nr:hypothetical protein [Acidobacteriota bacterium]